MTNSITYGAEELAAAERFLHEKIPLTRAMEVRVVPDPVHGFALEAPVAANVNHLGTAFGGSINAVATLAGYVALWLLLRESGAHIVITKSTIRFLQPIAKTIRAVCVSLGDEERRQFLDSFAQAGKARLSLEVRVFAETLVAVEFQGRFLARKKAAQ